MKMSGYIVIGVFIAAVCFGVVYFVKTSHILEPLDKDGMIYEHYLTYLDCVYDENDSNYEEVIFQLDDMEQFAIIHVTYKNGKQEEKSIPGDRLMELTQIVRKYSTENWENMNDVEYIDGDTTQVHFTFKDGDSYTVSAEERPKSKSGFFNEIKAKINTLVRLNDKPEEL